MNQPDANNHGKFVISLDLELLWGVRDKKTKEQYGKNILGARKAISEFLNKFDSYGVNATFAAVGFLFFDSKSELMANIPERIPQYCNQKLSPYQGYFNSVGNDEKSDPYHFGRELMALIGKYRGQEIGSHTFSHYYCLEDGQTAEDFKADIETAKQVAATLGIDLTSLVFPRNQFNASYGKICSQSGIICYRGNESSWLYRARKGKEESQFRRALRLIDAYINISGYNCHSDETLRSSIPMNLRSSRFLRPFSSKLRFLEALRLKRITSAMTHAAKHNLTFHLWWHPHNFGVNQEQNFNFLDKILKHYMLLNKKYNYHSYTMTELAKQLLKYGV